MEKLEDQERVLDTEIDSELPSSHREMSPGTKKSITFSGEASTIMRKV